MAVKFSNNASTTLAASISSSATTITLASSTGSEFPTLGTDEYFYATLVNSSNQLEVVKVTARSGDTLTVVRGQEDTTARSYTAGDLIELRLTAQGINDVVTNASAEAVAFSIALG